MAFTVIGVLLMVLLFPFALQIVIAEAEEEKKLIIDEYEATSIKKKDKVFKVRSKKTK